MIAVCYEQRNNLAIFFKIFYFQWTVLYYSTTVLLCQLVELKGIIHPKMKMPPWFTHPSYVYLTFLFQMKAIDLSVSPAPLIYCCLLRQRNGVANCLTMSVSCFWQILDTEGGYIEGPIWEVRLKALDCGSWDALCLLGWQEDLVVNRVKSSGQIQQDKYWRNGIRSCKS